MLRLRWLRLVTWERRLHLRLPLASSLHETPGDKQVTLSLSSSLKSLSLSQGFSLLLCVDSPVLLAGTAVFLPYRSVSLSLLSKIRILEHHDDDYIPRDNVKHDVSGNIQLVRHGTAHQGPVGQEVRIKSQVIIIIMISSLRC